MRTEVMKMLLIGGYFCAALAAGAAARAVELAGTPTPARSSEDTPTATPTCTPMTAWLIRSLPDCCSPGVELYVSLTTQGPGSVIVRVEETVPEGWLVTEPAWDERDGATYTWHHNITGYMMVPAAGAAPGQYVFAGWSRTYIGCDPDQPLDLAIGGDQFVCVLPSPSTPVPTPDSTCVPEDVWLERDLPYQCMGGVEFTVRLWHQGSAAAITRIDETLPANWTVVSPPWDKRVGNTYTWLGEIDEYTVLPSVYGTPGEEYFTGWTDGDDSCGGFVRLMITGDQQLYFLVPTVTITPPAGTPTPPPSETPVETPTAPPTETATAPPTATATITPLPCETVTFLIDAPMSEVHPGDNVWFDAVFGSCSGEQMDVILAATVDFGTGEYWFFPSWVCYPPQMDAVVLRINPAGSVVNIIPRFTWPALEPEMELSVYLRVFVFDMDSWDIVSLEQQQFTGYGS